MVLHAFENAASWKASIVNFYLFWNWSNLISITVILFILFIIRWYFDRKDCKLLPSKYFSNACRKQLWYLFFLNFKKRKKVTLCVNNFYTPLTRVLIARPRAIITEAIARISATVYLRLIGVDVAETDKCKRSWRSCGSSLRRLSSRYLQATATRAPIWLKSSERRRERRERKPSGVGVRLRLQLEQPYRIFPMFPVFHGYCVPRALSWDGYTRFRSLARANASGRNFRLVAAFRFEHWFLLFSTILRN